MPAERGAAPGRVRLPPQLGTHRVLADGRTAALLRRDGELDWWCAPRFDGPPLLWSLLDDDGACARWRGVVPVDADQTPSAPSLRTVLRTPTGRVECLDGFEDGTLVRLVRAVDADLDLVHELSLGGFGGPGDEPVVHVACTPADVTREGARTLHRFRAARGTWCALLVGPRVPDLVDAQALRARLLTARATADDGVARASLPSPHPERSQDALRVLEALAAPTGAVVAALTTSLPEAVPGDRQWDYRYCWVRDAALGTSTASLLGATTAADAFLRFTVDVLGDAPLDAPPLVTSEGGPVPEEVEVAGVAGWAGVQPVRVGNGARHQVQHDALGLFVEAISLHVQTGGSLDAATWRVVRRIADDLSRAVLDGDLEPSSGVWELRRPRMLVSEDVGRWLALDRALWLSYLRPGTRRGRWRAARRVLRERVLGAVREDGTLPLDYDDPDGPTDATALFLPLFGMDRGEVGRRLVRGTLARLGAGPFVYRYDPAFDGGTGWDGLQGREGAFLPVTFMAVGALAAVGLHDEAHARLDALCTALPRLLPEMWEPGEGRGLGNVPLLWSHMELTRALYLLDVTQRQARWGRVGFAGWRVARYVRLRVTRARGRGRP